MSVTVIRSQNLDANEAAFFGRQLEHVKAKTYDKKYPALKARVLFPVDNSAGPAADAITWREWDSVGMAKIISNYASDLPRADVYGRENTSPVKSIGNSYGFNIQEIRKAAATNTPLQTKKSNAARQGHEQAVNTIAFNGDADNNLPGLLSNPNIPTYTVPADGTASATTFASKTATQILRDMNKVANDIVTNTKGAEVPDTLVMPLAQYNLVSTTEMPNIDKTVLQFFLDSNPFINEVGWCEELNGAGTAGADIMMAYARDPDCLELQIPSEFEQFPAQEQGLEFVVPCHSRIGGLTVYRPLSMNIAEGI